MATKKEKNFPQYPKREKITNREMFADFFGSITVPFPNDGMDIERVTIQGVGVVVCISEEWLNAKS